MPVRRDRVPPTGPANGNKFEVSVDVEPIPPQSTLVSLPPRSARFRDSVTVNPFDPPPIGIVLGGARISDADQLEINLGNLNTAPTSQMLMTFDVMIRRI
jgi:hypothetical protein